MAVLPLAAYASAGAIPSRLFVLVPLAALVALGLHLANALPDIDADRAAGVRSLPVVIGGIRSRWAGPVALALAGVIAWAAAVPLGQAGFVLFLLGRRARRGCRDRRRHAGAAAIPDPRRGHRGVRGRLAGVTPGRLIWTDALVPSPGVPK